MIIDQDGGAAGQEIVTRLRIDDGRREMTELSRYFPQGVKWDIPYDSSRFVKISITEVVKTLFEAVALVFIVMFVFLQNWRYTVIPTIVVPIALLGTFAGERKPDGLLIVVDASNLDNHLRFALQLIHLGLPTVVALNMIDMARRDGLEISAERLSAEGYESFKAEAR